MLDIKGIVNEKLDDLRVGRVIEDAIAGNVEQAILDAVNDTFREYEFNRNLREQLKHEVGQAMAQVDFSTYNGYIISTMTQMLEGILRQDIQQRLKEQLEGVFLFEKKEVKLSGIFAAYRSMLHSTVDEDEQYEREYFETTIDDADGMFLRVTLHSEPVPRPISYRNDFDVRFNIMRERKGGDRGHLYNVQLLGRSILEQMNWGHLDDVGLLLAQCYYHQTPILIDIEDDSLVDKAYHCGY